MYLIWKLIGSQWKKRMKRKEADKTLGLPQPGNMNSRRYPTSADLLSFLLLCKKNPPIIKTFNPLLSIKHSMWEGTSPAPPGCPGREEFCAYPFYNNESTEPGSKCKTKSCFLQTDRAHRDLFCVHGLILKGPKSGNS